MELIGDWAKSLSEMMGLQPWAITVFLIVLAAMLLDFAQRSLMKRFGVIVSKTSNLWDDAVFYGHYGK